MMLVMIVNIDSRWPNLALEKIRIYHENKGDKIIYNFDLARDQADKVYVSCVFSKNRYICEEWEGYAEIGGSGYDIEKKLPEEIDKIKARINWGFTTRGCIRNCWFCIVPQKEGGIKETGDIYDIWDGKSKEITLMDNNILALPEHFKKICGQIKKENLRVDFNQGLDIRLFNDEMGSILSGIKTKEIRFGMDSPGMTDVFKKKESILKKYNIRPVVYVFVAGNQSWSNVMTRLQYLKSRNYDGYLMRHESVYDQKKYIRLAQWVNQHGMFRKLSFKEFCKLPNRGL